MHKLLTLWLACTAALLAGCNTMEGIGKDIKKGGQVLEDAAKKK
ncbi:MAG: entericidin A/B family lipoprotein [Burkholderiaceae bacterium]